MLRQPKSVLFCCDHNAVRSPMAEGITKKLCGHRIYIQSVGVMNDLEIDGFAIAVCAEIDVQLSRHRSRSFEEMEDMGEALAGFDLVIALSEGAHHVARELAGQTRPRVEHWPILDPTGIGETRAQKLEAYRRTRDQLLQRLQGRWDRA